MIAPKPLKSLWRERIRRMTIAAGYVCDAGVVLCADTEEAIPGYTKNNTKKLMAIPCGDITLVFAGAGDNDVQIDETAYEIGAAVIADEPKDGATLRTSIRKALRELFPREHYPRQGGVEVQILMAVKSRNNAQLFKIFDCNFAPVRDRVAIGSGVVLASQLMERYYDRSIPLNEVAIICAYVLHHAKKWVDGCGGYTDIALIPRAADEAVFMPSADVKKFETYAAAYDDAVKNLLLAIPRTPKNPELFEQYIQTARRDLYMARAAFQEYEDTMREVAAHIGKDYDEMMREAEDAATKWLRDVGMK